MSAENLERMFSPESVAVFGFGVNGPGHGPTALKNLVAGGFSGRIYSIYPGSEKLSGCKSFRSVRDLPEAPDLVLIDAPLSAVPEMIAQCAAKGAGGVILLPSGGRGAETMGLNAEIQRVLRKSTLRVMGAGCQGIIAARKKLNASLSARMPVPGKMAFLSQSGAISEAILDFAGREHIGFSYFINTGTMFDVGFADLIDYLGSAPEAGSIVMYMENLSRIRSFMSAARAVSRIKPIIVLKSGRSEEGAAAAVTHTGSLTSEDAVYDAAFKRAGIVRVKTFAELFDCTAFIGKQTAPKGSGLAIVTNAGGPGIMAVDALHDFGASPASLSPETIEKLDAVLPTGWSGSNPVDILDDATPERFRRAAEVLVCADEVDGLLIMQVPFASAQPDGTAHILSEFLKDISFPVFTAWLGGKDADAGRAVFNRSGIPTFDSPERAVRAFIDLYHYRRNIEALQQVPRMLPDRLEFDRRAARRIVDAGLARKGGLLNEIEAKQLLMAYGIAVNLPAQADDAEAAVHIAEEIGYPVAMKIVSGEIVHKSDMGGVVLDIRGPDMVLAAFNQIRQRGKEENSRSRFGISVQKMLPRGEFELIVGARKDGNFGPVLLFGLGGTLAEILKDRCVGLPPLNRLLARRMIEETKVYRLLSGYRNRKALDILQLESLLVRLSQLVVDFPEIREVEINPLAVDNGRVVAADARAVVALPEVEAPFHLVISPYPNQYEEEVNIEGVGRLTLRPIRPEDAPLLEEMFSTLSSETVYFRFFNIIKRIPPSMLARYTQIDYDREIAMAALAPSPDGTEKMLGVSRIMSEGSRKSAEFAVVVADRWQGKGIGAALLKRCLDFACEKDFKTVWAVVLPENSKMLAMARKMGFEIKPHHGTGEYEVKLDLAGFKRDGGRLDELP